MARAILQPKPCILQCWNDVIGKDWKSPLWKWRFDHPWTSLHYSKDQAHLAIFQTPARGGQDLSFFMILVILKLLDFFLNCLGLFSVLFLFLSELVGFFLKLTNLFALISQLTQFWRGCTSWDSGEVWQRPGWCHWGPLRGVCLHHVTMITLTMILIIIYHRPHHKGKAVYQQSCGARQNQAAPASHPGWSEW